MHLRLFFLIGLLSLFCNGQAEKPAFSYSNVFDLQYVTDPQISPDGEKIVYRRMRMDIMNDRAVGDLWILDSDGNKHQKLTSRDTNESSPRWSPSGDRIAFVSSNDEGSELFIYWTDSGRVARISQLPSSPGSISWSPSGEEIAFTMFVKT
uniref:TolB family protein n=1 Tax=Zeaxanthinibacter enoshimensis TaxID=392009 RepID=UPI003567F007